MCLMEHTRAAMALLSFIKTCYRRSSDPLQCFSQKYSAQLYYKHLYYYDRAKHVHTHNFVNEIIGSDSRARLLGGIFIWELNC